MTAVGLEALLADCEDSRRERLLREATPTINAARRRIDALADDVGRLARHVPADGYAGFLVSRLADHVEALDTLMRPTAADYYRGNIAFGADEDEALAAALDSADARSRELKARLHRPSEVEPW